MSFATIEFGINDGIARRTLNRPKSLNSFNEGVHRGVGAALNSVEWEGCRV